MGLISPELNFHALKKSTRSISVEQKELDVYVAGVRVGLQPLQTKENHVPESLKAAQVACKKNLVWILARLSDEAIPSWTGCNILARNEEPVSKDVIGYLPTINAPATELNKIFEVLNASEEIRKGLFLERIVVVVDQAIYAKATEIVWK